MKKGCAITLIVLAVIVFIGYLGARYVFTHFLGFISAMEQMEQLVTENTKRLNEQFPFAAPETPSLSETQMNAYLNVLRPMHEITQNNDFQTFSEEMKGREDADEKPTFSDMTEFFQNMADAMKDTYTQYFRLLEEQQLSPDEYIPYRETKL